MPSRPAPTFTSVTSTWDQFRLSPRAERSPSARSASGASSTPRPAAPARAALGDGDGADRWACRAARAGAVEEVADEEADGRLVLDHQHGGPGRLRRGAGLPRS